MQVPTQGNFASYLFSNPLQHTPNHQPHLYPDRTFDGKPIPPQRPILVHAGTGATVTWDRARKDVLRAARSFSALIGHKPAPFTGGKNEKAVVSGSMTVMIHLPNCFPFPILSLGAIAAKCTVSPVSVAMQVPEIAAVLAKLRPHIIVTSKGAQGETLIRKALQQILDAASTDSHVRTWAQRMTDGWDARPSLSFDRRRVWLVDLERSTDHYLQSTANSQLDQRDWSILLQLPPGVQDSDQFKIETMQEAELKSHVALILWSSGTTGSSKGVLLSHYALMATIICAWEGCAYRGVHRKGGEIWVALAPWFHVYGLTTLLFPVFAFGATLVVPAEPRFHLESYLNLLTRYRASFAHIAPPVAVALKNTPLLDKSTPEGAQIDLSTIQGFLTGGAAIPPSIAEAIFQRTGKYLFMGYGATEACGSIAHSIGRVPKEAKTLKGMAELGAVGKPMPNLQIRIAPVEGLSVQDTRERTEEFKKNAAILLDNGEAAPKNHTFVGEIQLRSPMCFIGYLSAGANKDGSAVDEELTRDTMTPDGYLRTGDEGVFDGEGNIWITGRIKELIKVKGGFQCAPPEIEACFAQHGLIADVACCGFYDKEQAAEFPMLFVVPKNARLLLPEADAKRKALVDHLAQWVSNRVSHYKQPKFYAFIPSVIKNPGGKIMRKNIIALDVKRYVAPKTVREPAGARL